MPKHDLLLNSLRMLLIGACVELTFARGSDIRHDTGTGTGNGQTVKMSGQIANGMKILGGNNETVLSLLSAQEERSHKPAFVDLERSEERDTGSLAAANHSSMTTQHNSRCVVHHNSYSFLYDTKSQKVDAATQGPTNHPLQLESFLETQSRSQSINDSGPLGVHVEDPDVEASQQIIRELESEWESSQQTQKQLPGDLDFDLALSEEVVSELQQTFDLSGDLASTPEPGATLAKRRSLAKARDADTTLIGLNTVTPLSNFVSKSCASTVNRTVQCQGTPELFSSCKPTHKKLTHLGGGAREQSQSSPYFSPELFGPTPLVCRLSGPPANTGATPSSLRSKMHTPKRSLLHDSSLIMTTPLCHAAAVPQDLMSRPLNTSGVSNNYSCISTPHTQSKESNTILSTASSPDLFS